jgi:MFS family permease
VVPLFYGMFLVEAALGAYQTVWPLWMERLGAEAAVIGILLASTGILRIGVVGPSAALADRFGAKRLMLISRLLLAAGYFGAFLATQWVHLLPVILLMAIGEIVFPLAQAYVAHHSPESSRVRAFTLIFNVGPSVALVGAPLLSALAVALFGIRAAFFLAALFSVSAFVALRFLDTDEKPDQHVEAPSSSFRDAIGQRPVLILFILQGLMIFSLSLGISFVPTFLEDVREIDASTIALLGAFPAVGSFTFGLLLARSQTIQQRPLIGVAAAVAQTMVGLAIFHQFGSPAVLWFGFFLRGGFFSGWITFISAIGTASEARHRARSFAMSEIIGGLSFASGPLIAGFLYDSREQLPFEVSIALAAMLIPTLLVVQRRVLPHPAT